MQDLLTHTSERWFELIEKAKLGCGDALGELLEPLRKELISVAQQRMSNRLRSKFDPADIIQTSMIDAQRSIREFRGSSALEFRKWVRKIVVHNLTDEIRRYTHTQSRNVHAEISIHQVNTDTHSFELKADSDPDDGHWQMKNRLAEAVAKLSDRRRFVFDAKHRCGSSYDEIAGQLGVSKDNVRQIYCRACQQVREIIGASC